MALALTSLGEVGIDLEMSRPLPDAEAMADLVIGPDEPMHPRHKGDCFLRYWTRKEPALKATGVGLRVPLRAPTVSPAAEPTRLVRWPGMRVDRFSMVDLVTRAGYCGALTLPAPGPFTLHELNGDELMAGPVDAEWTEPPSGRSSLPPRQVLGLAGGHSLVVRPAPHASIDRAPVTGGSADHGNVIHRSVSFHE